MSQNYPDHMVFDYRVSFRRRGSTYSLLEYNSPYEDSDREMEDVRLAMEGLDLNGKPAPGLKIVPWETVPEGEDHLATFLMSLTRMPDGRFEQAFRLKEVSRVKVAG